MVSWASSSRLVDVSHATRAFYLEVITSFLISVSPLNSIEAIYRDQLIANSQLLGSGLWSDDSPHDVGCWWGGSRFDMLLVCQEEMWNMYQGPGVGRAAVEGMQQKLFIWTAKSGVLESPTMALEHNPIFPKLQWFVCREILIPEFHYAWQNVGNGICSERSMVLNLRVLGWRMGFFSMTQYILKNH